MSDSETSLEYYEILAVTQNASQDEIEESYRRMQDMIGPDSLVVYSMMEEDELQTLRERLETAYQVLSDPATRAAYDGGEKVEPTRKTPRAESHLAARVSCGTDAEAIGVAERPKQEQPALQNSVADALMHEVSQAELLEAEEVVDSLDDMTQTMREPAQSTVQPPPLPQRKPARTEVLQESARPVPATGAKRFVPDSEVLRMTDAEFGGATLKRLRESAHASLQDLADVTKIGKGYLRALEDNDFDALPAAVYVRGFVVEYARALGLDSQTVAKSYMALYRRYRDREKGES